MATGLEEIGVHFTEERVEPYQSDKHYRRNYNHFKLPICIVQCPSHILQLWKDNLHCNWLNLSKSIWLLKNTLSKEPEDVGEGGGYIVSLKHEVQAQL